MNTKELRRIGIVSDYPGARDRKGRTMVRLQKIRLVGSTFFMKIPLQMTEC